MEKLYLHSKTNALKSKPWECDFYIYKECKENTNTVNANNNKSTTVYITKTGSKYHSNGCQYLRRSKILTTLGEALSDGYTAYSKCSPLK